jgi:hypothetical protein
LSRLPINDENSARQTEARIEAFWKPFATDAIPFLDDAGKIFERRGYAALARKLSAESARLRQQEEMPPALQKLYSGESTSQFEENAH